MKPELLIKRIVYHGDLGKSIIQFCWKYGTKQEVNTVENFLTDFGRILKKKKHIGNMYPSYYHEECGNWQSSPVVRTGDVVELYDPATEYGNKKIPPCKGIIKFDMCLEYTEDKGGVDDKFNDCLYKCLYLGCNSNRKTIPEEIRIPSRLKTFLKLNRFEKVDSKYIKDIDELFKTHKINLTGDEIYISPKTSNLTINIKLKDGHYTLIDNKDRKTPKKIRFNITDDMPVYIFKSNVELKTTKYYDGVKFITMPTQQFYKDIKNTYKYICYKSHSDNIEKEYDELQETRYQLFTATKIDIFKYDHLHNCILETLMKYSKALTEPEEITNEEAYFIDQAYMGGLRWCEKDYQGQLYGIDRNSSYPAIVSSNRFVFPVKAGTFKKYTQEEFNKLEFYSFGIYHCHIENDNRKLFSSNLYYYYTQHDLRRAKELNMKISIIEDGSSNALLYERDKLVRGDHVFGAYVDKFYELKKQAKKDNNKILGSICKDFLNLPWGLMCKKNKKSMVKKYNADFKAGDGFELNEIQTYGKQGGEFILTKYINTKKVFKSNYARLGVFLTSYCRYQMSKTIEPYSDQVKRIHTDGFYLTFKPEHTKNLVIGENLGEFHYEKEGIFKIKNMSEMIEIK
jgi:hypothetical protein